MRIKCSLSRQNLGGGRVCEGGGEDPGWPGGSATGWLGKGREMQDSEREGGIRQCDGVRRDSRP